MEQRIANFLHGKKTKALLLALAALLLLLAAWIVFGKGSSSSYEPTEREARLMQILSEIEGVEDVSAMITEEEGKAVGAVVVFEGKDSALTRARILDVVSSALRLEKKYVQVYPAQK